MLLFSMSLLLALALAFQFDLEVTWFSMVALSVFLFLDLVNGSFLILLSYVAEPMLSSLNFLLGWSSFSSLLKRLPSMASLSVLSSLLGLVNRGQTKTGHLVGDGYSVKLFWCSIWLEIVIWLRTCLLLQNSSIWFAIAWSGGLGGCCVLMVECRLGAVSFNNIL